MSKRAIVIITACVAGIAACGTEPTPMRSENLQGEELEASLELRALGIEAVRKSTEGEQLTAELLAADGSSAGRIEVDLGPAGGGLVELDGVTVGFATDGELMTVRTDADEIFAIVTHPDGFYEQFDETVRDHAIVLGEVANLVKQPAGAEKNVVRIGGECESRLTSAYRNGASCSTWGAGSQCNCHYNVKREVTHDWFGWGWPIWTVCDSNYGAYERVTNACVPRDWGWVGCWNACSWGW